jgi:excisionase family DNA binding protein
MCRQSLFFDCGEPIGAVSWVQQKLIYKENRMHRLVRLSNAAERLGVKPSTLRDWFLKRKHLDFVKAGRAVCITEDSIERFIAANTIPAREAE